MFRIAVRQYKNPELSCQGQLSGYDKKKESAIPEQDNVPHLFKPESSKGEGQMRVFIPVD